ncbi:gliding motility-associated C-terminal domain-containing protein [Flavobacteriaceae bacterium]|nr:gliding motility-associated C-terminal domain-containing protein [Flavobacteriaceae bacterium]
MKKIILSILVLLSFQLGSSQVLNQPANWPNTNWTTSGTYGEAGLLADPTTADSFTFDDDAAGSASDDDIASESPVIDLTAAFDAGETLMLISGNYTHYDIGGLLSVDYWDYDAGTWVSLQELGGSDGATTQTYPNCTSLVYFESGLDITSFTATQLSNFKYRISYDDADGWQWGWCIKDVSIVSGGSAVPGCDATVTSPVDGETGVVQTPNITWSSASGFPEGYYISVGTTDGGNDILDNVDTGNSNTYALSGLSYSSTYYLTILPYNGSGPATDTCSSSSFTTVTDPNTYIDCITGPITTSFCYDTGLDNSYSFTSLDGSPMNLTINSGQIESNWDELIILDSDGITNLNIDLPYGNGGDLSGLTFQSSGDNITLIVDEDGSVSCVSSGYNPIDFTVACATCVNPIATYTMVTDCLNGPQFFIDVDLTDVGSATSLSLFDNQNSAIQSATATGVFTFGPYDNNTDVVISVTNDDDANCSISSSSITQEFCTTTLVDCSSGPLTLDYCYDNNNTTDFIYTSSDGVPVNLTINSGNVESGWDEFIVYDSDGVTELTPAQPYYGNAGDLSGLTFQSTGDTISFVITSDGSVSCGSGSGGLVNGINYTVACATCINPQATYTVIDDCDNGDQFLIDVNVISLGDADSLTISDNQGGATQSATATGIYTFGPYPFLTNIVISVANDQDVNCVINSNTIQLFACPPANDNCSGAITLVANADENCTESGSGTLVAATASSEPNACGGSDDDDVWFEFTAVSENHAISLYNISGDTTDLYHVLYQGDDCNDLSQIYCSDANESVASGLTVGETYRIRVYSFTANELQNLTFDICIFTVPPAITTDAELYTVSELVTDVLIDSECSQAFNVTYSTGSNFGTTNGIGYFEANGSSWPFESGLIMTSGDVINAVGPETGVLGDGTYDWPGDADLESVIPGLNDGDTNNASVIEFDFIPVTDHMSFDFIFAAEEYGTFQCTFTDAFAFLLTDTQGVTTNLAIVPGTVDPISVLTVRDDQYNANCESVNPEFFGNYYGPGGLPTLTSPTNFLGHTIPMTAEADVIPNELYHIKLVVADDGDTVYDSAVFIAAGSFNIGDLDLGEDILLASGDALCQGQEMILDAGGLPNNSSISWFMDGNLIEGANDVTITVSETAFYSANIVINGTDCTFADEILIEFFPVPVVVAVDDNIIKCVNENYIIEVEVTNSSELNSLTYYWSLDGIDIQVGPESTYSLDDITGESGEFTVSVFDDITSCWSSTTIQVELYENSYCVDQPQGLSPNGDGINDCLILDHLEDREDISTAEIFNRYGTKVFELNEYVDQWCGTDQDGDILPVGTYFYIIYFNSGKEPITSWIYLNY